MQRVEDTKTLSLFKQIVSTAASEAEAHLKAHGKTIKDVLAVLQMRIDTFLDVISEWSDFNRPCKHTRTGNAKIKFWIIVVSPDSFMKTVEGIPKNAPPVRLIETDYDYFLFANTEIKSGVCNHELKHLVKRECSFGRRSNVVRIYVMLDREKSALTMTKTFRCACKENVSHMDITYTALDFKRCFHHANRTATPKKCELAGMQLFTIQNEIANGGIAVCEEQRIAFTDTLKHCENYTRMCRTCNRYGMFLNRCGGCKCAWYCDEACQMKDWKEGGHAKWCRYRRGLTRREKKKNSTAKTIECGHCLERAK